MNEPTIEKIALARLKPSKTNPRQHFDRAKLDELIASVGKNGIIQPLLARPDWCMGKTEEEIAAVNGEAPAAAFYDLVAGERRFRAATELQLADVPVIVHRLSDKAALELQLIENLQRADLTPIEEAEAYRALMNIGYTVQLIHERTGKATVTIWAKLKMLSAPKAICAAVESGKIGARIAELVGRIPVAEMREAAGKQILHPPYSSEPLNYRQAEELVRENYMRSLSGAPFEQKDETLVPVQTEEATGERIAGGACTDCPMKTGNRPDLFGDVKRTDVCTNPKCFAQKSDVHFARVQEAAAAEGKKLLTDAEAKHVFDYDGAVSFGSAYVKLNEQPDREDLGASAPKKPESWKKMLATLEAKPQIVLARDPKGRVVELVDRSLAIEAINLAAKAKGETSIFENANVGSSSGGGTSSQSADQKRLRTLAKLRLATSLAAMGDLVAAIEAKGAVAGFWDMLIEVSIRHAGHDGCWLICKRLELDPKAKNKLSKREGVEGAALEYGLSLGSIDEKMAFLVELLISQATKFASATYGGGLKGVESFTVFAKLYGVEIDAVEKRVKAALAEKKAPSKKGRLAAAGTDTKGMHWLGLPEDFAFNENGVCDQPAVVTFPLPKASKISIRLLVARTKGGWVSAFEIDGATFGCGSLPSKAKITGNQIFASVREALKHETAIVLKSLRSESSVPKAIIEQVQEYSEDLSGFEIPYDRVPLPRAHDFEKIAGMKYRCRGCGAAAVKQGKTMLVEKAFRGKACSGAEMPKGPRERKKPTLSQAMKKAGFKRVKKTKPRKAAPRGKVKKGGAK